MRCSYCGQENPDGAVFCKCGRPLSLNGGYNNPFPMQTPETVKHRKAIPIAPFLVIFALLLGTAGFFGYQKYMQSSMTDESKWSTVSGEGYSIKVPKMLKKGEMLTAGSSDTKLLDFYTSDEAGFDVSVYKYTEEEKAVLGGADAESFLKVFTADGKRTRKINDQVLDYKVREGKDYIYASCKRHCINHIKKTDDVYYIAALFPASDGYYVVNVYCAEGDKSKYEEAMLGWLDTFQAV